MTRDPSGTNESGLHEITSPSETTDTSAAPVHVRVAQASAAAPAGDPPAAPKPELMIKPGVGNVVTLPAGTSLAQLQIEGDNIVLLQPDGTRVVIEGGALDIPTFIIGGAEIPQDALLLAFKASDIDVAAGPEGLSIVTAPQAPDSGGSNFAQEIPGIGDAGPPIDLLDPTALQFGALEAPELGSDVNFAPVIEFLPGGVSLIDVIVDEDALGGAEDGNSDPGGDPVDGSPPVDPDGTDPDKNSGNTEVVTGAFQLSDPNGVADVETLTITGPDGVPHTFAIGSLVNAQVQGEHGILTITSYNPATGVGTFEYELTGNIDGPTANNGENVEQNADSFQFVVSDGVTSSPPATLNVDVVDDVPELNYPNGSEGGSRTVDEDDIRTNGPGQPGESRGTSPNDGDTDGSYTGDPNTNGPGPAFISGNVGWLVNFGADGPQSAAEGGAFNVSSSAIAGFGALGLTSKGEALSYSLSADGSTFTAFVDGGDGPDRTVFEFKITDSQTGEWEFRLFDQLDHELPGGLSDENYDLDQGEGDLSGLDFGQYITATDGDGDVVTLNNQLVIEVRDDVPELIKGKKEVVRVDEDDIDNNRSQGTSPDDGNADGSYTGDAGVDLGGAATVEGSLAHLVRSGADDDLTFSFIGAEGAVAKLTDLGLSSKGKDLSYSLENGVLTAYVDGPNKDRVVFKLTLNSDGSYKFELFDQLDHDKPQHGADQNFDLQDGVEGDVSFIDFGELIKATDHDGDSVILDGAFKVLIRDDVPEAVGTEHRSANENDLANFNPLHPIVFNFWQGSLGSSPYDGPSDGSITGPSGTVPVWGSLADNVKGGADENGKFHLVSENKAENLLADLGLSSKGDAIDRVERINIPGVGDALGFFASDGRLVFGLFVGEDGIYNFRLFDQLDHAQGDDPLTGAPESVIDNLDIDLSEFVRYTDRDGDTIDLGEGTFVITVVDDVPQVCGAEVHTINENDLANFNPLYPVVFDFWQGSIGTSPYDGATDDSITGLLGTVPVWGTLADNIVGGADEFGKFSLVSEARAEQLLATAGSTDGEPTALTSKGVPVNDARMINIPGIGDVMGFFSADGRLVFGLFMSEPGIYNFRLFDQLDHALTDNPQTDEVETAYADTLDIDLSQFVIYTDRDGDATDFDPGQFVIRVTDDIPLVVGEISVTLDEDDLSNFNPLWTEAWSQLDWNLLTVALHAQGSNGTSPDADTDLLIPGTTAKQGFLNELIGNDDIVNGGADEFGKFGLVSAEKAESLLAGMNLKSKGDAISDVKMLDLGALGTVMGFFASDGRLVFSLTVNELGGYDLRLFDQLDHTGENGNVLAIDLSKFVTYTDADGDMIDLGEGNFVLNIVDDSPIQSGATVNVTVEEEHHPLINPGQFPELANGNEDLTDANGLDTDWTIILPTTHIALGDLKTLVKGGADETGTFSLNQEISGQVMTAQGVPVTSKGAAVVLDYASGEVVGFVDKNNNGQFDAGDQKVFSLQVDADGDFTFTLFDQIDHQFGDNIEDYLALNLAPAITYTDADGDTLDLTSGLNIRVIDDKPVASITTPILSGYISLDETKDGSPSDTGGNNGDEAGKTDPFGYGTLIAINSGKPFDDSGSKVGTDEGAGAGKSYALLIGNINSGLFDGQTGEAITLSQDQNGNIVGSSATGGVVFVIGINPADGTVTIAQYRGVQHDNPNDPDEGILSQAVMTASAVKVEVTVTDADGDKASASTDIGGKILFEDDGPKISVSTNTTDVKAITQDADTIGTATDSTVASFSSSFSASPHYGSDGAGSVSWSYSLAKVSIFNGVESGLTKDGAKIRIFEFGGVIYGSVATGLIPSEATVKSAANLVFKISVNPSTGEVTLDQYQEIDHSTSSSSNYEIDTKFLGTGFVKLVGKATITDGDGDSSSAENSIDLGGKIGFNDHGPNVVVSGATEAVEQGPAVSGTWVANSGADNPLQPIALSINGVPKSFTLGTGVLIPGVGTLTIKADGTWTFTALGNQDNDPTNPEIKFALTVKDSDGDTHTDEHTIVIKDGALNGGQSIALALDDDNLAGGTTQADSDSVSGQIGFSGSDNLTSIVFGDTSNLSNLLTWTRVGDTQIVGYDNGVPVVRLDLSVNLGTKTSTVTATLLDNYDSHTGSGDDLAGLGTVKVIATDIDGTQADGTVTVSVSDDVPSLTVSNAQLATLTVDETSFGTDASANFSAAFTAFYGADGAHATQALTYALALGEGPTGLVDTATGQSVVLSLSGGVVLGRNTNGDEVFRITVDSAGNVTLNQSRAVVHADPANHDEPTSLATNNLVKLTGTIKDGDGDTDSETVNIGSKFVFEDDGPKIFGVISGGPVVGDNLIQNGSFEGSGVGPNNWDIFNNIPGWTDGGGPDFEVQTDGAGGPGPIDGTSVVELDGDTGDRVATTIGADTNATIQQTVSGTEAGVTYEISFYYAPREGASTADSCSMEVLWNGSVVKAIDSTTQPNGWQLITVRVVATGTESTLAFRGTGAADEYGALIDKVGLHKVAPIVLDDEDTTRSPAVEVQGSYGDDGAGVTATGQLSFDAGADGLKSIAFAGGTMGFNAIWVDANGVGHERAVNAFWTPNGAGGGTLTGTAVGDGVTPMQVFTLTVAADGSYTFTLKAPLKHNLVNDPSTPGVNETSFEDNLTINLGFRIADRDNDTATGTLSIIVDDDSPVLDIAGASSSIDEGQTVNGTYTLQGGADGVTLGVVVPSENHFYPVTYGVGIPLVSGLGTLTINADGTWTFKANSVNADATFSFELRATDGDGDRTVDTHEITINNGDMPFENAQPDRLIVEEEHLNNAGLGLPNIEGSTGNEDTGIPDDTGFDNDTDTVGSPGQITNFDTTGQLTISGGDGAKVFGFNVASGAAVNFEGAVQITSKGEAVFFVMKAGEPNTLYGVANGGGAADSLDDADDRIVFTITLNPSSGQFTFTLVDQIDHHSFGDGIEGTRTIDLSGVFKVNDSDADTADAHVFQDIKVDVIDDVPVAQDRTAEVTVETVQATVNALFILDKSGSMSDADMDLAKDAILEFASQSNVKSIRILAFDHPADAPSAWFDLSTPAGHAALEAFLNPISGSGDTNYEDAIYDAQQTWTEPPVAADITNVYFISDGDPTERSNNGVNDDNAGGSGDAQGLTSGEKAAWEAFLQSKGIDNAYAIGIGASVSDTDLQEVAWPNSPNEQNNVFVISSPGDLTDTLQGTLQGIAVGNAITNLTSALIDDSAYGADGPGYVSELRFDLNGDKTVDHMSDASFYFNGSVVRNGAGNVVGSGSEVTFQTGNGGTMTFNFATGAWSYSTGSAPSSAFVEPFKYKITDGDGDQSAYANLSITVSPPPNDAPVISGLRNDSTFTEDTNAIFIDSNVSVSDTDSANFAGGTLTVSIVNAKPSDILAILNEGTGNGEIGLNGSNVTYNSPDTNVGEIVIGTWTGGTNGNPLVITFNGNATPEAAENLIEAITFENTSENPDTTPRQVTIVLTDGDGGTSSTATTTVNVVPVNDAPELDAGKSPTLNSVAEDAAAPVGAVGTLVSQLVADGSGVDNIDDPDGGALGIAVTGTDTANGTWYYSLDGGTTWTSVGSVSGGNALLLDGDDRLYFKPNAEFSGTSNITFRAWDHTSGTAGDKVPTNGANNGGTTAFSDDTDTATVAVTPVNDQPTAVITPPTYAATEQVDMNLHGTGLSVSDVDAGNNPVTVTLSVGFGVLTVTAGNSGVTGISGSGTSSVTVTGTLTQINNLLSGNDTGPGSAGTIVYNANSDTPPGSTVLTLQVNDGGNSGAGGALTNSDTATITIVNTPENAAPDARDDRIFTNAAPVFVIFPATITVSNAWLLQNDSDADGDTVSIESTNSGSSDGVSAGSPGATETDVTVYLTKPGSGLNAGTFSYVATDGTDDTSATVTVHRGSNDNVINGEGGDDILIEAQGANNVTMNGGAGRDIIIGGSGSNTIIADDQDHLIDGNGGTDTLSVASDFNDWDDDQIQDIEVVTLTNNVSLNLGEQTEGFTVNGTSGADTITTGSGNDVINSNGGSDTINTGAGQDRVVLTNSGTATNWTIDLGNDNVLDKIIFNDAAINSANNTVATVNNFKAANDRIAIVMNGTAISGGSFVTVSSNNTDVSSTREVIEITADTSSSLTADGNNLAIETLIANAIRSISGGTYTVIVYSGSGGTANAGIYAMNVSGNPSNLGTGNFSIEHLMTLNAVGFGALGDANFVAAADPLILDLDGNGYSFSDTNSGAAFDINADGKTDKVAWNTSNDGILAMDLDGDGVIDNGRELFTPNFNGGDFLTGGEALGSLDENMDGLIDDKDSAFSKLLIWQDANANGISEAGELSSLSSRGIASLTVDTKPGGGTIDGQDVVGEGTYTNTDGTTGGFVEVDLETEFGTADTFVVDADALNGLDLPDIIADYSSADGDVIDLTGLFDAQGGDLNDFVKYDNGFLQVDTDGAGTNAGFENVAQFSAPLPANTTIAILFTDSHTSGSDDGSVSS